MKQVEYDEIYDEEKIEKDNYKSMRELSKYTKILEKEDNLSFILKNHHEIKVYNSKSLYKISMLLGNLPEENVSFTFYAEEEDEQSEEKSSKKNILKTPRKSFIKIKNESQKKENKKENKVKEEKSNDIYLLDKINEQSALEVYKNGNIIGYDPELFKKIWKNLYIVTLLISSIGLIGLLIYSQKIFEEKNYLIWGAAGLNFISLCLMIIISISGNNKMKSKKKVNFNKENVLLFIFILLGTSCISYWIYLSKENSGLNIISMGSYIIFGFLLLMSFVLLYLNRKMIDFYKEYHKIAEEGTLLIEVQ